MKWRQIEIKDFRYKNYVETYDLAKKLQERKLIKRFHILNHDYLDFRFEPNVPVKKLVKVLRKAGREEKIKIYPGDSKARLDILEKTTDITAILMKNKLDGNGKYLNLTFSARHYIVNGLSYHVQRETKWCVDEAIAWAYCFVGGKEGYFRRLKAKLRVIRYVLQADAKWFWEVAQDRETGPNLPVKKKEAVKKDGTKIQRNQGKNAADSK
jgi:hypothetical protein